MFKFVSIGGDCQPAAQIRKRSASNTSHFFDWLGIPIRHTVALIENGFEGFLDRENMHPIFAGDGFMGIVDTRYRADIRHEMSGFTPADIATIQAIYALRSRWFMEMLEPDELPVYFVRIWGLRDGEENEADARMLYAALRSRRRDVRLLYLHNDPTRGELIEGAFRSAYLQQTSNPYLWEGDDEAWRYVLGDFALRAADGDDEGFTLPRPRQPNFNAAPARRRQSIGHIPLPLF